jgi:hypothetical protein
LGGAEVKIETFELELVQSLWGRLGRVGELLSEL